MKVLRTLAYAAIILTLMLLLSALVRGGSFHLVFSYLGFGSFVPFSLATAAVMQDQKGLLVGVVVLTLVAVIPSSADGVARAVVPIGAGIALGVGLQRAVTESREEAPRA